MALVSTGQITITDHNDGKNLVAAIMASLGASQAFDPTETDTYTPDWGASGNTLTARVYAASAEVAASLSNKNWAVGTPVSQGGSSLGTGTTLGVGNLAADRATYYFEGDYTDSSTGLVTHVIAQIELMRIRLGTNATWVRISGVDVIDEAVGATKAWANLKADLYRGSSLDDTGLTYKWFVSPFAAADQLDANHALVTGGSIKFRTTAQSNGTPTPKPLTDSNLPTTTSNPADGAYADVKEILVKESAVADLAFFMVQITDSDGNVFQGFVTVYDVSDPYDVKVLSSAGDKFQNGNGSTNLTPEVWNGSTKVTDLTGWTFDWTAKDKNGNAQGFVNTARQSTAKSVNTNTAHTEGGAAGTITLVGTFLTTPVAGDVVKAIKPDGSIKWFEVGSATNVTNAVLTLRASAHTVAWANASATAAELAGAQLFLCVAAKSTSGATALAVTGDDIDIKGTIFCAANRP